MRHSCQVPDDIMTQALGLGSMIPSMHQKQQQQGDAAGGADLQLLQQLKMREGKEEEEELQVVVATWDCGSPLYDSLELASLHYVLEKHTMVLPFPDAVSSWSQRWHHRHRGIAALPPDMAKTGGSRYGVGAASRRRRWRGSKAAAAIFRALTCWRR